MEVVGLAAATLTLAKAVRVVARTILNVCDAPKDFTAVANELNRLAQMIIISHAVLTKVSSFATSMQDTEFVATIKQSVEDAMENLKAVRTKLDRAIASTGFRGRLMWVLVHRREAKALLGELQSLKTTLTFTFCAITILRDSIDSIVLVNTNVTNGDRSEVPSERRHQSTDDSGGSRINGLDQHGVTTTRYSNRNWSIFGYTVTLTYAEQKMRSVQRIAWTLRMELPFGQLAKVDAVLRNSSQTWTDTRLLSGTGFSVCTLVEEEEPLLLACLRGDIVTMQQILSSQPGKLHIVTSKGNTPIRYAIDSRSLEAVRVLIDSGVDADKLFGELQTSPLMWAVLHRLPQITRLLLDSGASMSLLNCLGWSPPFYLWQQKETFHNDAVEIIQVLVGTSDFRFAHKGIRDVGEYGLIHHAVKDGTIAEIEMLLQNGVSPHTWCGELQWTAIHVAVWYGRFEVVKLLEPYFINRDIDEPDARGWTLLHIAAAEGHQDIAKYLLVRGANWRALTKATRFLVYESLYDRECTVVDVCLAEIESQQRKLSYLRCLHEVKGLSALTPQEIEDLGIENDNADIWTDALEAMV